MLKKQLITLAAMFGILACGACFLPGSMNPPPPPPPLQIDLRGIRSVDAVAANASASGHLDPANLALQIAIAANEFKRETGVRAQLRGSGQPADGTLAVTVLEESAEPASPASANGAQKWTFRVRVAVSLTTHDGREIWHQAAHDYFVSGTIPLDSAQPWESGLARGGVPIRVAVQLVHTMYYGDTK